MHELSIAESILETVRRHIEAGQATCVRTISVRVGVFSGLVPESLEFCFDVVAQAAGFPHAHLAVTRVPARRTSHDCAAEFTLDEPLFACPACEGGRLSVTGGNELDVIEAELVDVP